MLQLPGHLGGLAMPNFQVYYWAAVLVTMYWWFKGSRSNPAICVEAARLGSLQDLQNLVYRGVGTYSEIFDPTRTTLRVWAAARHRFLRVERWAPVQPLWGNPNLAHFRMILDPQVWIRYDIRTLRDIMPEGVLMTFSQLSRLHNLPGWMFFRYSQLRHAARAQFPEPPLLQLDPIEDLLSRSGLEKPLSALYGTLLTTESPKMDKRWDRWKLDIPTLDKGGLGGVPRTGG